MTTTSALSSSPAVPSRTARATAQDLGAFVTASPSAFHAVQETARRLREAGFTPLQETDHWSAQDVTGDRYVIRDGSIIAWSTRSEEHTSELQSRGHLVCRLLLEKQQES